MYTVTQEFLTPVRITPWAPPDHFFSQIVVNVGGRELFYKCLTHPQEMHIYGEERVRQRVNVKLRRGIMCEIEAYLFQIDAFGQAMGPQV